MKKILIICTIVVAITALLYGIFFWFNSYKEKDVKSSSCDDLIKYVKNWEVGFSKSCEKNINKDCREDNECDPFPCVENKCLIKKCTKDSECPNNMCGLHATPTPGFCATVDVI